MSDAGPPAPSPETDTPLDEARRKAIRDNARRVLHERGVAEILRKLNSNALQGRGAFEEYDSGVIFRWGHGYTRRHICAAPGPCPVAMANIISSPRRPGAFPARY